MRPFQSEVLANRKLRSENLRERERESDDDGDARKHCRCHRSYAAPDPSHRPLCLQAMAFIPSLSFSNHQGSAPP